eukprot:scaffold3402_cov169-Amphora_coffeaeformis.AAC.23
MVARGGPPIRAKLNSPCSRPRRAPCSSGVTAPVVCVVSPVAKAWEDNSRKTDTKMIWCWPYISVTVDVTNNASQEPNKIRDINPTCAKPSGPHHVVKGAMATAPKAATANMEQLMANPSKAGSKFKSCVRTKGNAVECIEADTPPITLTVKSGNKLTRMAMFA